jgi:hypothetical protein
MPAGSAQRTDRKCKCTGLESSRVVLDQTLRSRKCGVPQVEQEVELENFDKYTRNIIVK